MSVGTKYNVSVAQLDRVSASDAEGCGFNPRRIRHKRIPVCGDFFMAEKIGGLNPRGREPIENVRWTFSL